MPENNDSSAPTAELLELTTEIVSAFVCNNSVTATEIPTFIQSVHSALAKIDKGDSAQERPNPAVPIKRSVTKDYLICLEDGKKMKMLKRHLRTNHGMSPAEYRERWGLASDYPMTAPKYAEKRSKLAKKIGLGKKPRKGKKA